MPSKYDILTAKEQESQHVSQHMTKVLEEFLNPLLLDLDRFLDKRLVRTFLQCIVAIIRFRNSKQGLLLSELGAYLTGYQGFSENAAAGTKRISNLIRSLKWSIFHIDRYLLKEADREVVRLKEEKKRILCIWDGSVIEKPESSKIEGLAPVVSSKAKRLSRSRYGLLFNPGGGRPIRVMGMQWTTALISGLEGIPKVAAMNWWTTKGEYAQKQREKEEELLRTCIRQWGSSLLFHVFDRGYASGYWIGVLAKWQVKFVIRWIKKHIFLDASGHEKKLWEIGRGKKYRAHKEIRDTATGMKVAWDLWWTPVRHLKYAHQLYLVKARVKGKVAYLITNEIVHSEDQAWAIFFSYKRRWQIETSFRYGKCELAMESPRVWSMENRQKLLGMVALVYTFFLYLLEPFYKELLSQLLHLKCHRTGKRCQEVLAPLYRLRWALSRLWNDHRPLLESFLPPHLSTLQVLPALRC